MARLRRRCRGRANRLRPLPKPRDYTGPRSYYEFLQTVKPEGVHGEAFHYRTANTDALGWILARVTGKSVAQLLSERIWGPMGAEQDAYMSVDSIGTPFAGGGLSAGLRDLARFGEMIRNNGVFNSRQIVPAIAVGDIRRGGRTADFAQAGYSQLPGWSYRSMWWVTHNEHGAFAARGVHGQTIYIDPKAEMVIVRFASHPVAGNAAIDPTSLPAYHAMGRSAKKVLQRLRTVRKADLVPGDLVLRGTSVPRWSRGRAPAWCRACVRGSTGAPGPRARH
jgi:CubicO group peptidase (beta-lactamase class C family)